MRFITVPYAMGSIMQYARLEVMERFVGASERQFNLRLVGGIAPTDADLVATLRLEFNVPEGWAAVVLPLAGDRTVLFREVKVASTVPMDPVRSSGGTGNDGDGAADSGGTPPAEPTSAPAPATELHRGVRSGGPKRSPSGD